MAASSASTDPEENEHLQVAPPDPEGLVAADEGAMVSERAASVNSYDHAENTKMVMSKENCGGHAEQGKVASLEGSNVAQETGEAVRTIDESEQINGE